MMASTNWSWVSWFGRDVARGKVAHLVGVRRRDKEYGALHGDLPRAPRMHLAEEQVDDDADHPQEDVILPVDHRVELLRRGLRAAGPRSRGPLHGGGCFRFRN